MIGSTLSHYLILEELGRGGMGIVYRSTDKNLNRDVAIKVLPASALASADDRARFFREAQAAAQLSHPNIATVYQVDEAIPVDENGAEVNPSDGQRPFIAMEYIDGESLGDYIAKSPLKLDEALRFATEIASALELAHEHEIVHRDIKTANIMLTSKGVAKVLDFGLAQTAQSTKLTRMGATLGTIAYMSPEQARGEEVDLRTDLWALGVVLYEMLVGTMPFASDYEQAAIYSILNEDPEPITALRSGIPMELEFIVNKLLAKETRHRYQGAKELLADLSAVKEKPTSRISNRSGQLSAASIRLESGRTSAPGGESSGDPVGVRESTGLSTRIMIGALGLALGILITWLMLGKPFSGAIGPDSKKSTRPMRLSLQLPPEYPMSFFGGSLLGIEVKALDLSSDGRRLVYVADSAGTNFLVIHEMNSRLFERIPDTESAFAAMFSPDGQSVAFFTAGDLRTIRIGASRSELVSAVSDADGLLWADDGVLYWLDRQGNVLMKSSLGQNADPEVAIEHCQCFDLGKGGMPGELLLGKFAGSYQVFQGGAVVGSISLSGGDISLVGDATLVFTGSGSLLGTRFNPSTYVLEGPSFSLINDLRTGSITRTGQYAFSSQGTLIYATGGPADRSRLVIRDTAGRISRLPLEEENYGAVDATRNGNRLVVDLIDGSDRMLFIDLGRKSVRTIAQEARSDSPILNEEGTEVTYAIVSTDSTSLVRRRIDTGGAPELILTTAGRGMPSDLTSDNRFLAYSVYAGAAQIRIRDLVDESESVIDTDVGNRIWSAKFSPDDRFVAYTEVGSNGSEVFVEPFPLNGTRRSVSSGGCEEPEWRDDADELIYRCGQAWYGVSYSVAGSEFQVAAPRRLFDGPYLNIGGLEYRVLSEGRVLLEEPVNTQRTTDRLEVVTNWFIAVNEALDSGGQ